MSLLISGKWIQCFQGLWLDFLYITKMASIIYRYSGNKGEIGFWKTTVSPLTTNLDICVSVYAMMLVWMSEKSLPATMWVLGGTELRMSDLATSACTSWANLRPEFVLFVVILFQIKVGKNPLHQSLIMQCLSKLLPSGTSHAFELSYDTLVCWNHRLTLDSEQQQQEPTATLKVYMEATLLLLWVFRLDALRIYAVAECYSDLSDPAKASLMFTF